LISFIALCFSSTIKGNPTGLEDGQSGSRAEETAAVWFEFVWSATRAIRKDITQQQLCDVDSVALVEKCTRFHIVCAARLVAEDQHTFSAKLNDENATKCLQTLEHMYEDIKQEEELEDLDVSEARKNEPEFRAYKVNKTVKNYADEMEMLP